MDQYRPQLEPWPTHFAGRLPVSELFYSLQGEGRFAGHPAVFIRFKYCNLGCIWCDTRFTWDPRKIEPGELLDSAAVANRAAALLAETAVSPSQTHIVLTGGEPMLHQDRLPSLIAELKLHGFDFFEIETNGVFVPTPDMVQAISWWNCSPKLRNNGLTSEQNIIPEALRSIGATGRADFKFVVQGAADIDEIERDYLPLLPRDRIILMPEGVTRDRQLVLTPPIMQECATRGFRFSLRLHILAWGNERGR